MSGNGRVSRAQVEYQFRKLAAVLGKRPAAEWNDVGGWRLDHNAVYGGYMIEEITSTGGAIGQPLGYQCFKPAEFERYVLNAIEVLRIYDPSTVEARLTAFYANEERVKGKRAS